MDVEVEVEEAGGVVAPLHRRHLHPLASHPSLVAATSSEEEQTRTRPRTMLEPSAMPLLQGEARTR